MAPSTPIARPLAEGNSPAMAEIESQGRGKEWSDDDFDSEEDALVRWHAVALFGLVLLGVGGLLYAAWPSTGRGGFSPLYPFFLGVFLLAVSWLVGSVASGEYGFAVLGGGIASVAAGFYLFLFGVTPGTLLTVTALLVLAGGFAFGVGALESWSASRSLSATEDEETTPNI